MSCAATGRRPTVSTRWGDWRAALGLTETGRATLERACAVLERRLAAFGTEPDRFGLIHADLNARNILVDAEGSIFLIDFDRARIRRGAGPSVSPPAHRCRHPPAPSPGSWH